MIPRLILTLVIILSLAIIFIVPQNSLLTTASDDQANQPPQSQAPKLSRYPIRNADFKPAPPITARSAIVIDTTTGIPLHQKESALRHLPASTTKLMTALIALEKCSPQTQVQIVSVQKEGTQMGLEEGDIITVESLLYGLLLVSGNDAAYALANVCSDSYSHFIASMNQKAKELAMVNTHFTNPAGFDSQLQYSTASDLARLAKVAVTNPLLAKIVATQSTVVTDVPGKKTYYLENINKLLGQVEGAKGVKTGHTEGSMEILISETKRGGNSIITVVLGSQDRFEDSKKLIEWTFANYTFE